MSSKDHLFLHLKNWVASQHIQEIKEIKYLIAFYKKTHCHAKTGDIMVFTYSIDQLKLLRMLEARINQCHHLLFITDQFLKCALCNELLLSVFLFYDNNSKGCFLFLFFTSEFFY